MIKKMKNYFHQLSPKLRNTAATITVGTFIITLVTYTWNYHNKLVQENEKLKSELIDTSMTLWVKNNTKEPRNFKYNNILEGNAKGEPIAPGRIKAIKIKKGVYNWLFYDARKGFTNIDTIKKGQLIFKYHQQKEIILINE